MKTIQENIQRELDAITNGAIRQGLVVAGLLMLGFGLENVAKASPRADRSEVRMGSNPTPKEMCVPYVRYILPYSYELKLTEKQKSF